jgi:hypothetical protein
MLSEATYVLAVGNGRGSQSKFVVGGNDFAKQVGALITAPGLSAYPEGAVVYANLMAI